MSSRSQSTRPKPRVIVVPPEAWAARPRLFSALEQALDIEIRPAVDDGRKGAVAAIVFGEGYGVDALPALVLPAASAATPADGGPTLVEFADDDRIDRSVRGTSLEHVPVELHELDAVEAHQVLARVGRSAVWTRAGEVERLGVGVAELGPNETLRARLSGASFLPLLPIVNFLRGVANDPFTSPPLRAAFMFDDPNLHSTSYGFLRYEQLVAESQRVGYHVAFATIPLDLWYASRSAVRLFHAHPDRLSLLVHGNDHLRRELGRPLEQGERRRLLARAMQRVERFERRTGLRIARVMAPPHGAISEALAAELPRFGFDALCVSRPYPWLDAPPGDKPASGWLPIEVVAGGLPVIPRLHLDAGRGELAMRAFLRQPIVLYGHHEDVRDGLDVLEAAAERVRSVGDAAWLPLDRIVETSYDTWVEGTHMRLRLQARRATVALTAGVAELTVETPRLAEGDHISVAGELVDAFPVGVEGGRAIEIRIERDHVPGIAPVGTTRVRPWPAIRRGMTEARDRLLPLRSRT